MSEKKTKLKAGCGVVTLFGLGYIFGAVSLFVLIAVVVPLVDGWKSDASKKFIADRLADGLKLTDAQREQVRPIVNEFLDQSWDMRRDYLQQIEKLREEKYLPRINELLSDDQKGRLRQAQEKWRREHQDKMEEAVER